MKIYLSGRVSSIETIYLPAKPILNPNFKINFATIRVPRKYAECT